jgi:hypothetical protein
MGDQPTVESLIKKLQLVLDGKLSRETVADWALTFVMDDEPNIEDEVIWELLQIISGIDIKESPAEYLHAEEDIKEWIIKFNNS